MWRKAIRRNWKINFHIRNHIKQTIRNITQKSIMKRRQLSDEEEIRNERILDLYNMRPLILTRRLWSAHIRQQANCQYLVKRQLITFGNKPTISTCLSINFIVKQHKTIFLSWLSKNCFISESFPEYKPIFKIWLQLKRRIKQKP